uniref:Uncharacterized protein n=1 Tax=Arundo donax TaxID=35708 RepID=A0A0A9E485_ARUDO
MRGLASTIAPLKLNGISPPFFTTQAHLIESEQPSVQSQPVGGFFSYQGGYMTLVMYLNGAGLMSSIVLMTQMGILSLP